MFQNALFALAALSTVLLPTITGAQTSHRFWIMWEQIQKNGTGCQAASQAVKCKITRNYTTRLLDTPNAADVHTTIGRLDQLALTNGRPVEHPDALRICQDHDPEVLLGFDPEHWELSEKLAALKDLPGVFFSVEKLTAPEGYTGEFGARLQKEITRRFQAAGIKVLTKRQMEKTPGRPQLNIYFSRHNRQTGCHFSIFASLTQTMLLTRNIQTKLKVGTWGMSEGPSDKYPNHNEYDAIIRVANAFVANYLEANTEEFVARR